MVVKSETAPAVKHMARAKELHCHLDTVTGQHFHSARHAALAARDALGPAGFRAACATIRQGDRAKHGPCGSTRTLLQRRDAGPAASAMKPRRAAEDIPADDLVGPSLPGDRVLPWTEGVDLLGNEYGELPAARGVAHSGPTTPSCTAEVTESGAMTVQDDSRDLHAHHGSSLDRSSEQIMVLQSKLAAVEHELQLERAKVLEMQQELERRRWYLVPTTMDVACAGPDARGLPLPLRVATVLLMVSRHVRVLPIFLEPPRVAIALLLILLLRLSLRPRWRLWSQRWRIWHNPRSWSGPKSTRSSRLGRMTHDPTFSTWSKSLTSRMVRATL